MSDLNDEIIEEILARLPAKSLLRFNLVCKKWRSLISHPNFVKKHLHHVLVDQSNNHHHKLIAHPISLNPSITAYFYSINYYYYDEEEEESLNFTTERHFPLQFPRDGIRIVGSCNGLLLIGFYGDYYTFRYHTLVLWNPLLRADYNILPECSSLSISDFTIRLLGFCYDSSTGDYKVVRVITTNSKADDPMRLVVEIFSLKTSSWKTIQGAIPYGKVLLGSVIKGTPVNGSIYWVVADADYQDEEVHHNLILVFDLIDEKFRLAGVPRDIVPEWGCSLVEVRGCLGLYQTDFESPDVEMWILKEDENKKECWTKLMTIPKDCGIYSQPTFFMKNDDVLLCIQSCREDKKLVVYNPVKMTFRDLPSCVFTHLWEQIIYVETLVSPNGFGR